MSEPLRYFFASLALSSTPGLPLHFPWPRTPFHSPLCCQPLLQEHAAGLVFRFPQPRPAVMGPAESMSPPRLCLSFSKGRCPMPRLGLPSFPPQLPCSKLCCWNRPCPAQVPGELSPFLAPAPGSHQTVLC